MSTYYSDSDPDACAWLEGLIRAGVIPNGVVDCRSIVDVKAEEIAGFTQHHFFAGIGVWAHALRKCGWPDHVPVMTGSPPCQAFSIAGKQVGFDDPRHLFPVYMRLINELKPLVLFGEQVSGSMAIGPRNKIPYNSEEGASPCSTKMSQLFRKKLEKALICQLANRGSNLYDVNLSYHRMPSQRLHFLLAASARHTSEKDSGLLHRGWPTPTVRDGKGGYQGGRIRNGKYSTNTLDVTAQLTTWPQAVRVTGSGMMWTGSGARMGTGGQLNPALSRWLMGLPKIWDEVGPPGRIAKLKGYGNAIVPQVAETVIRSFMQINGLVAST